MRQTHLANVTLTTASRQRGSQLITYGCTLCHHSANNRSYRKSHTFPLFPLCSLTSTGRRTLCTIFHAVLHTHAEKHQYLTKLKTKGQLPASRGMSLWPVSVCLSICLSRQSKAASLLLSSGGYPLTASGAVYLQLSIDICHRRPSAERAALMLWSEGWGSTQTCRKRIKSVLWRRQNRLFPVGCVKRLSL